MKRSAHRAALVFPQFFLSVSAFQARYFFRLENNAPTASKAHVANRASPTGVFRAATRPRIDVSGPKVYGLPYRHSTRRRKPADKQRTSEERAVRIAYKRESKSLRYAFSSL